MEGKLSNKKLKEEVYCRPEELSLKSFFVGPQAENAEVLVDEVLNVLQSWILWRKSCYPEDGDAISVQDRDNPEFQRRIMKMRENVRMLLNNFSEEIPKFSPRYLGHMFSEISMPAIIGNFIALLHNPNNVSRESSRVGVDIEAKAIRYLGQMVGYSTSAVGHFTSGGTVANFEAVYRAKNRLIKNLFSNQNNSLPLLEAFYTSSLGASQHSRESVLDRGALEIYQHINAKYNVQFEGPVILVPDSKHYSWVKAAALFGFGRNNLVCVDLNKYGQMCVKSLRSKIDTCLKNNKPVMCITSIFGTTELGTLDPVDQINKVICHYRKMYNFNFWHHVDAAYGGFFATLRGSPFCTSLESSLIHALRRTTSITIDPHKLGYVPYSAGAFICNNPTDYFLHEVSAPYVDFELNRDLGPYTIEGSRSATGATALLLTAECIGLDKEGYGQILERTVRVAHKIRKLCVAKSLPVLFVKTVGTNIIGFAIGCPCDSLSEINNKTKKFLKIALQKGDVNDKNAYFVSKTSLGINYSQLIEGFCKENNLFKDSEELALVRLTIMNPFIDSLNSNISHVEGCVEFIKSCLEN